MNLLVCFFLHPLLLIGAWLTFVALDGSDVAPLFVLLGSLALLTTIEGLAPAEPRWTQTAGEKLGLFAIYLAVIVLFGIVLAIYDTTLAPMLAAIGEPFGLDVWPTRWPLLAQATLLFFVSEFIYYWIHRGLHRSSAMWRLSGHGFHHAFHNLHAVNAGATHPLEILFLALPVTILGGLFGAETAAVTGAGTLLAANATMAHANLAADTPVLNWFVTGPAQHRRHHSTDFDTSNTNYSCNAILWDRLFGTYSAGPVAETGIGPREPTFWQKLALPVREPVYVDTVAHRRRD